MNNTKSAGRPVNNQFSEVMNDPLVFEPWDQISDANWKNLPSVSSDDTIG